MSKTMTTAILGTIIGVIAAEFIIMKTPVGQFVK